MNKLPFFSIIVVSLNAEQLISKTIQSILDQTFLDYEIIIKDACSIDKTIDQIPENDRIFVYTTKDNGIYDGMNEAISYAKGKYLLFLNCGDFLADADVLSKIYQMAKKYGEENTIIYGDYCRNGVRAKQPSNLTDFYLYRTPLCHQTVFFGKGVLQQYAGYNTKYKILADYDLTLKSYRGGTNYVYCPCTVCNYLGGGVSESEKGIRLKAQEREIICNHYFSAKTQKIFRFKLMLSMKGFRQKLASDTAPKWVRKMYRTLVNIVNR